MVASREPLGCASTFHFEASGLERGVPKSPAREACRDMAFRVEDDRDHDRGGASPRGRSCLTRPTRRA